MSVHRQQGCWILTPLLGADIKIQMRELLTLENIWQHWDIQVDSPS